MNHAVHAIRTQKQISAGYLQQLQTCVETNKDYLSKVENNFVVFFFFVFDLKSF
jgi:hypothetical protein